MRIQREDIFYVVLFSFYYSFLFRMFFFALPHSLNINVPIQNTLKARDLVRYFLLFEILTFKKWSSQLLKYYSFYKLNLIVIFDF